MSDEAAGAMQPVQPIYQDIDAAEHAMTDHAAHDHERRAREAVIYRELGARLRAVRLACGVSQEELAQRLGIERVTLSRYESGARTLPLATLLAIAELLHQPIAAFVPDGAALGARPKGASDSGLPDQPALHPDIARIAAVLTAHPELIAGTQSFLDAMLAPDEP